MKRLTVLLVFLLLITSCGKKSKNDFLSPQTSDINNASVNYGFLRNSLGTSLHLSNNSQGLFYLDFLEQYNETNSNKGMKYLLKYYDFDSKTHAIIHNNPSIRCTQEQPEKCSGLVSADSGGRAVIFYNNNLFDYTTKTSLIDESISFNLYKMDLDGTNRKLVYTHNFTNYSNEAMTAIYPVFHNGFVYLLYDNDLDTISLEDYKEIEKIAPFLNEKEARGVDQIFLYGSNLYLAVGLINEEDGLLKNALYKVDLNSLEYNLMYKYDTHLIVFYDEATNITFLYDKDYNLKMINNEDGSTADILEHSALVYTYKDYYALFYDSSFSKGKVEKPQLLIIDKKGETVETIELEGTPWNIQGIIDDQAYYYADNKLYGFDLKSKEYIIIDTFE